MTYEMIEEKIEQLNKEITKLHNKIVSLTWINKNFTNEKVESINKKIDALMDQKYELIDLL